MTSQLSARRSTGREDGKEAGKKEREARRSMQSAECPIEGLRRARRRRRQIFWGVVTLVAAGGLVGWQGRVELGEYLSAAVAFYQGSPDKPGATTGLLSVLVSIVAVVVSTITLRRWGRNEREAAAEAMRSGWFDRYQQNIALIEEAKGALDSLETKIRTHCWFNSSDERVLIHEVERLTPSLKEGARRQRELANQVAAISAEKCGEVLGKLALIFVQRASDLRESVRQLEELVSNVMQGDLAVAGRANDCVSSIKDMEYLRRSMARQFQMNCQTGDEWLMLAALLAATEDLKTTVEAMPFKGGRMDDPRVIAFWETVNGYFAEVRDLENIAFARLLGDRVSLLEPLLNGLSETGRQSLLIWRAQNADSSVASWPGWTNH